MIFNWNKLNEDFQLETDKDQINRVKMNIFQFQNNLGTYTKSLTRDEMNQKDSRKIDPHTKWFNLCNFISLPLLSFLFKNNSHVFNISSMTSVSRFSKIWKLEQERDLKLVGKLQNEMDLLKIGVKNDMNGAILETEMDLLKIEAKNEMHDKKHHLGMEHNDEKQEHLKEESSIYWINFSDINLKNSYPVNCTPFEKTKYSLDKSHLFENLVRSPLTPYKSAADLVGDFQASYILFQLGLVYDAFEQWKILLSLFCHCKEAINNHALAFRDFVNLLVYQMDQFPDLCEGQLEGGQEFLEECFLSLVSNTRQVKDEMRDFSSKKYWNREGIIKVEEAVDAFIAFIAAKFDWEVGFDVEEMLEIQGSEYAPQIVDVQEMLPKEIEE